MGKKNDGLKFKRGFRGYKTAEVNKYIIEMDAKISALTLRLESTEAKLEYEKKCTTELTANVGRLTLECAEQREQLKKKSAELLNAESTERSLRTALEQSEAKNRAMAETLKNASRHEDTSFLDKMKKILGLGDK